MGVVGGVLRLGRCWERIFGLVGSALTFGLLAWERIVDLRVSCALLQSAEWSGRLGSRLGLFALCRA